MKYLCRTIKKPTLALDQKLAKMKKGVHGNYHLPDKRVQNSQPPDLTLEPFYCFPFEDVYDGVKEKGWKPSSKKFYEVMYHYHMCVKSKKKVPSKEGVMMKSLKRNAKKIHKTRENKAKPES